MIFILDGVYNIVLNDEKYVFKQDKALLFHGTRRIWAQP